MGKKVKKSTQRSTDAEVELRVNEIFKKQIEGSSRSELVEFIGKTWGLQKTAADNLIAKATVKLKETNSTSIQETMGFVYNNYIEQLKIAKAAQNGQLCLSILKEISKLKGLEQHTINHVIEDKRDLAGMSDDELDSMLANTSKLDC